MWGVLLKALMSTMAKNAQKSAKGGKADATLNIMDLIPGASGKAETSTMGTVKTAPADYYKSAEASGMGNYIKDTGGNLLKSFNPMDLISINSPMGSRASDITNRALINPMDYYKSLGGVLTGKSLSKSGGELLKKINPLGTAEAAEISTTPPTSPNVDLGVIPVTQNTDQFNRISNSNPEELPTGVIPEQYRGMGQGAGNPQNTQRPDVGFMRGLINAATAQPQPEGLGDVSQGRKTAYYSGELIPKIIMSKLGQSTPTEASIQQTALEDRENKKPSPEYQQDLGSAVNFMKTTKLTDDEKVFMYQRLSAKYPQRSTEIKRIFFPQSQDNSMEEMLRYLQTNPIR